MYCITARRMRLSILIIVFTGVPDACASEASHTEQMRMHDTTRIDSLRTLATFQVAAHLSKNMSLSDQQYIDQHHQLITHELEDQVYDQLNSNNNQNGSWGVFTSRVINSCTQKMQYDCTGSLVSLLPRSGEKIECVDTTTGSRVRTHHSSGIYDFAWHPHKQRCALLKATRFIICTHKSNPIIKRTHSVKASKHAPPSINWSKNGSLLIVSSQSDRIELFETANYTRIRAIDFACSSCLQRAVHELLLTADLSDRQCTQHRVYESRALSTDCRLLLRENKSLNGNFLEVVDRATDTVVESIATQESPILSAMSPDNRYIAYLDGNTYDEDLLCVIDRTTQQIACRWNLGKQTYDRVDFFWINRQCPLLLVFDRTKSELLILQVNHTQPLLIIHNSRFYYIKDILDNESHYCMAIALKESSQTLLLDLTVPVACACASARDRFIAAACTSERYTRLLDCLDPHNRFEQHITNQMVAAAVAHSIKKQKALTQSHDCLTEEKEYEHYEKHCTIL